MATTPSSIEPFGGVRIDEEGCTNDMNKTPRMHRLRKPVRFDAGHRHPDRGHHSHTRQRRRRAFDRRDYQL
jgi:hypothetical protein